MKVYLVSIGGYDSCYHLGVYTSLKNAKSVCENWIDEEIESLKKWEGEPLLDSHKTIEALKGCKEKGEFIEGGGSDDFPFIEEFTLNIRKRWC